MRRDERRIERSTEETIVGPLSEKRMERNKLIERERVRMKKIKRAMIVQR